MQFLKSVLVVVLSICAISSAVAQDAAAPTRAVRGYGQAGCGLGSLVFGAQKGAVQIFAATLNGTGGQTFGMTSGTSNCRPAFGRDATDFIDANRMGLASDIARGEGETIVSLAAIYKCQNIGELSNVLKRNYGKIFPSSEVHAGEINQAIINAIKSETPKSCDLLS